MNRSSSLLLVGCGKMGGAVLNGLRKNGFSPDRIRVAEPDETVRSKLMAEGITCAASALEMADFNPDIIFLAVKPFLIEQIIGDIKPFTDKGAAVLSIIAGRRIEWFKDKLGDKTVVFRAMPNTPAAIGAGITAVVCSPQATEEQKQLTDRILKACGEVIWLTAEDQIDAVTAVSGSGPAYVFYLTEALANAAKTIGLSEETAEKLARATVIGSALLMRESNETPAKLRQNVTTPNGTTAAALAVLRDDKNGFDPLMVQAVKAAKQRSKELSGA